MPIRTVSYFELASLRQCPHKHDLGYRQRWTSDAQSPALAKGSLMHTVLESHYRMAGQLGFNGAAEPGTLIEPVREQLYSRLADGSWSQNEVQELVEWMYVGHQEQYGADPQWEILAVEHEALVWLPTDRGGRSNFRLKMKIDLVVRWQKRLWLVDHKTGQRLPDEKDLALDDQFGLYVWGMRQLGRKVHGVIYNAIRTQRNQGPMALKDRFVRKLLYRTDPELDTLAVEAYKTFRRGYATPEHQAERYPNSETCKYRCEFTEACLAGRKGGIKLEESFLRSTGFEQRFERH